jgi:type II secretion system protein H
MSATHRSRPAAAAGMTLMEVVVVLALIGILCAIALPGLHHNFLPRYRLRQAARRLTCDMLSAQMRAVSKSRQYRIVFDTAGNAWRLEEGNRSSQSSSWSQQHRCCLSDPASDTYFPGVRLSKVSAQHLVFEPEGGQSAMSVTLRLNGGQGMKISTAMAGRIQMEQIP